jgi:hypothetical protein
MNVTVTARPSETTTADEINVIGLRWKASARVDKFLMPHSRARNASASSTAMAPSPQRPQSFFERIRWSSAQRLKPKTAAERPSRL